MSVFPQLRKVDRTDWPWWINGSRSSQEGVAPVLVAIVAAGLVVGIFTGMIWGPVQEAVKMLAAVADGVVGLLPDASNLGLAPSSGWIHAYTMLNSFLPLSEALTAVGVFMGVIAAKTAWSVGVTIYHLIPKPGVGT